MKITFENDNINNLVKSIKEFANSIDNEIILYNSGDIYGTTKKIEINRKECFNHERTTSK